MIIPSLLDCVIPRMARISPPLRASNEGFPRPRVVRAQGTHRAIPPLLPDRFSILPENTKANQDPRRLVEVTQLACTTTGHSSELPVTLRPLTVEVGVLPVVENSRERRHRRTMKSSSINNTFRRPPSSAGRELVLSAITQWPESPTLRDWLDKGLTALVRASSRLL
jgi:hypothetical protein